MLLVFWKVTLPSAGVNVSVPAEPVTPGVTFPPKITLFATPGASVPVPPKVVPAAVVTAPVPVAEPVVLVTSKVPALTVVPPE